MWKALRSGILIAGTLFIVISCSTAFSSYSNAVFTGKGLYRHGEFDKARPHFEDAAAYSRDPDVLAYLAAILYRTGDMAGAERLVLEAEAKGGQGFAGLRIAGYKALVMLKKDKEAGIKALKEYVDMYRYHYPLDSIRDVERMVEKGQVDETRLENMIEEQVSWYEHEVDQYISTRTGYFDRNSGHDIQ